MATVTTSFTISLAVGVPIGTLTAAYIDWHYIYLIIAGLTLINLLLINRLVPKLEAENSIPLKKQLLVIKDKMVITGLLTTVFWILGYTLVFAYISPGYRRFNRTFHPPLITVYHIHPIKIVAFA